MALLCLIILAVPARAWAGWAATAGSCDTGNPLNALFCVDNDTCFAAGNSGDVRKTTNAGASTWSTIDATDGS